jgi:pimeloyl-ACP methyl ester carboxylesterase
MYFVYGLIGAVLLLAIFVQLQPHVATRWALALERKRNGLTLKSQTAAGFTMPYLEGGRGDVLVLIHGFAGDKDNFTRMAGHLVSHFRVIVPDLPGFGDATRDPAASYRMEDQVARLHVFIRTLGIERMVLGGNSMGGFIASEYAARHPEQVRAVWLLDAAGTEAAHNTPMLQEYLASGEFPLLIRDLSGADRLIRATMSRPPYFPGFLKRVLAQRGIDDYALHSEILKDLAINSPMLESQYKDLPTPALIVWGAEDRLLNPAAVQTQRTVFPASQCIVMAGIGHVPMLEAPGKTAQDFLKFAAGLGV